MIVFKAYMKIIRQNIWMMLIYLAIFFGITMMFQVMVKGDEYSSYKAESVKVALIDEDGGVLAEGLKNNLAQFHEVKKMEDDTAALQEDLFYRNVEYIVRIPSDFFQTCIVEGNTLKVTKVPGSYTAFYVDQQVNSFLNAARTYYAAGFSEEEAAEAVQETQYSEVELLNVNGTAGEMPDYAYYFRYLPYLFLSVLCYAMGFVLSSFRKEDVMKRMRASAVPVNRQNLEGLLAVMTVGFGIWGFVLLAAIAVYRNRFLESGGSVYYLLNSVAMLLVALTLAYLVGILVNNTNALSGVVNVISLGMCFLCGTFVPMEYMSKGVIRVAQFLPVYWYEKVNDLLVEFGTVSGTVRTEIWQALGIQFAFAAALVCVSMAITKAKREG